LDHFVEAGDGGGDVAADGGLEALDAAFIEMQLTLELGAVALGVDEFLLGVFEALLGDGEGFFLVDGGLGAAGGIFEELFLADGFLAAIDDLVALADLRVPELLLLALEPHDGALDFPFGVAERDVGGLGEFPQSDAEVFEGFD
jgi:hypothetical protein